MKPCPTCREYIADNAKTCPKCGHVFKSGKSPLQIIGMIGAIACVALAVVAYSMSQRYTATDPMADTWTKTAGVGIVGMLVSLLLFGIGRMTSK